MTTVAAWAVPADLNDERLSGFTIDEAVLTEKLLWASEILYELTGRAWPGLQVEQDVRPCNGTGGWFETVPQGPSSRRVLVGACSCNRGRACGCGRPSEVKLSGPVVSIQAIRIDGEVIDSDRYEVVDDRWLVYLPHPDESRSGWPCCQDVRLPSTEEGTWAIDYTWGAVPTGGGVAAVKLLAAELVMASNPELAGKCRLGRRVQSAGRQGTNLVAADFSDGKTGLAEVDLWVASVLLGRQRASAGVYVPGRGQRQRRTTIPAGASGS